MKKRQTVEIMGRTFTVLAPSEYTARVDAQSVYDAYGRCSETKQAIWEDWRDWLWHLMDAHNGYGYGQMWVASHNCNFFTIGGTFKYFGEVYGFYITHTRQEMWKLENQE